MGIHFFSSFQKKGGLIFGVLLLVLIDQVLKYFVDIVRPRFEIFSWFRIVYAENFGIAFSLPITGWLTVVLTFIILGVLANWWKKSLFNLPFVLLFAGAIGNLIDRLFRGFVIDYLSFWSFPIFNFADICISFGVALLFWHEFKEGSKQ